MTIPNGADGINPDAVDGITGDDGSLPGQSGNDQTAAVALLKQRHITTSPGWNGSSAGVYAGQGITGTLGLSGGATKAMLQKLTGMPLSLTAGGLPAVLAEFLGIPATQIVSGATRNLLMNPQFTFGLLWWLPHNIFQWAADLAEGHDIAGSARVVADGTLKSLASENIWVQPGDTISVSGYRKFSGGTATGTPIKIVLEALNFIGGVVSSTTIGSTAGSGTAGWAQITGADFTVPSSGVSFVRAKLVVDTTMTAGTVWFDDIVLTKDGTLATGAIPNISAGDGAGQSLDLWNLIVGLLTGFGVVDGDQTPGEVGTAAAAVTDMQAAMAKSVAALKQELIAAQQAAGGNSIAMASDPFDGSGAMTANWDVRYLQPLSGGTVVRNGGQLVWSGFGVTEREVVCRWRGPNPVSLTDNQRVSIVLGSPLTSPSATASDQVVVRCNSAKTTYVKVKFRPTAIILVAVVNDVETVIHTETIPRQAVGTRAIVDAGTAVGPRWFKIQLGTVVYDINDSGAVSQYGTGFRGWGLGMYAQSILISQVFPGAIDYWQATDNPDMLSPVGDDSTTNYSGGNAASAGLGYISGGDALDAGAGIISGGHA